MALPMIGFGALVLALTRGVGTAARFTILPALLYVAWYATVGRDASNRSPGAGTTEILAFTHTGLSSLWQLVLRAPGWGGVVLLALMATALLVPASARARRLVVGGVLACVAMYLLLGLTRASLGAEAALASRYAYFGILMTLPALAVVLDAVAAWAARRSVPTTVRALSLGLLIAAMAASGAQQTIAFTDARVQVSPGLEDRVLGAERLLRDGAPRLGELVEPVHNPDITVRALTSPRLSGSLPSGEPTRRGILDASLALQVAGSPEPWSLAGAAAVRKHNVAGQLSEEGCAELSAQHHGRLDIAPSAAGNQVELVPGGSYLDLTLMDGAVASHPTRLLTTPGTSVYLGNLSTYTLRVAPEPGPLRVCR
jgi:hypothetical protein